MHYCLLSNNASTASSMADSPHNFNLIISEINPCCYLAKYNHCYGEGDVRRCKDTGSTPDC